MKITCPAKTLGFGSNKHSRAVKVFSARASSILIEVLTTAKPIPFERRHPYEHIIILQAGQ